MKLALVTAFPRDPGAPHGGVEAVSVNLAQALACYPDLDVHVVTIDPTTMQPETRMWNRVTIHRLPRRSRRSLVNAVGAGRTQVREYIRGLAPDVVHAHDTYGVMVKGLRRARVFTVHGFIHVDTRLEGGRLSGVRAWLWRRIETAGWADQPHIIAISPYVRERLNGIATGMIHDIDNPVPEQLFDLPRRERRGIVFSAAHISPLKNTLGLLEAFARLTDLGCTAELRLAGTASDPQYGRAVEDFVRRRNLGGRVAFLGQLSAAEIRQELAAASVFVLMSLQENAPMGIAEAMAVGVPVVTSNRCGMPYMVRDRESGFLVDPHDADAVARCLAQLLHGDELRERMGQCRRQIALSRFHPTVVAERTRAVYERALEDWRRQRA